MSFPSATEYGLKPRCVGRKPTDCHVDVRDPERLFPVFGGALSDITQHTRARGHALLERQWETVERVLRNTQRLEALESERGADPSLVTGIGRVGSVGERRNEPPQQLATGASVVNSEQDIDANVRRRPGMQGAFLDIVQFKLSM